VSFERTRRIAELLAPPGSQITRCESVNGISYLAKGETSRSSWRGRRPRGNGGR
jgi:hypothetical protein